MESNSGIIWVLPSLRSGEFVQFLPFNCGDAHRRVSGGMGPLGVCQRLTLELLGLQSVGQLISVYLLTPAKYLIMAVTTD